ncbi:unnamed protein product [Bemisia tabaci]|uniref:RING finger protein 141 n=1 Tax=Bemisia tabaci TaxID=7038 RepID=A0A9P0F7J8_BEMTA|nr:PREDICTED: RING finger protein 141-like [Bemisia tabaci]XP_018903495.1 PREDICTED: RING finger protein 141-like [Bemisia tabaci]CAH0395738.1 unnamed protein product [Bemisia tabaci]
MGQNQSVESIIPKSVENFVEENMLQHTRWLTEISSLTYEEFLEYIVQLNVLSQRCVDCNGKQLMFAVKKGTDATLLWKATVKIACVKLDPTTKKIESCKLLNLPQFLKVFKALQYQVTTAQQMESVSSCSNGMTASTVLREIDNAIHEEGISRTADGVIPESKLTECCICLERKPDVMLPCAHSYCHVCLEQWKVNNSTCPVCRETISNKDESWVISEAPNSLEISEQIFTSLLKIADSPDSS